MQRTYRLSRLLCATTLAKRPLGSATRGAQSIGYRATCHWLSLDQLAYFGAVPVGERVVIDRDRVTGAGVTSGIDFALTLAACLFGEERAKRAQLAIEYDPKPPFVGGTPASAGPELAASLRAANAAFQKEREAVARRAAAALQIS